MVTLYNTAVNELAPTAIPCEDSLVTAGHCSGTPLTPTFTQVLTAVEHTGIEGACMVPPQRCSDCPEPPEVKVPTPLSNQTGCPESPTHSKLLCNSEQMNTNNVVILKASFYPPTHNSLTQKELFCCSFHTV